MHHGEYKGLGRALSIAYNDADENGRYEQANGVVDAARAVALFCRANDPSFSYEKFFDCCGMLKLMAIQNLLKSIRDLEKL